MSTVRAPVHIAPHTLPDECGLTRATVPWRVPCALSLSVLRLMQMNNDTKVARVYRQLGWVCHKWQLELPEAVSRAC